MWCILNKFVFYSHSLLTRLGLEGQENRSNFEKMLLHFEIFAMFLLWWNNINKFVSTKNIGFYKDYVYMHQYQSVSKYRGKDYEGICFVCLVHY